MNPHLSVGLKIDPPIYHLGRHETLQHCHLMYLFDDVQIAALEDIRNRTMQAILWIQRCYRGLQSRHNFQELKKGATALQSCNPAISY